MRDVILLEHRTVIQPSATPINIIQTVTLTPNVTSNGSAPLDTFTPIPTPSSTSVSVPTPTLELGSYTSQFATTPQIINAVRQLINDNPALRAFLVGSPKAYPNLEEFGLIPPTPTPTFTIEPGATFVYLVEVQDRNTNNQLSAVRVSIQVQGEAPLNATTDENGLAKITVSDSYVGQPGFLIIEASDYERYTQNIDVIAGALPDIVQLEPVQRLTPTNTSSVPSGTDTPTSTSTPTPRSSPETPVPLTTITPTPTSLFTPTHTPTQFRPTGTPTGTPLPTSVLEACTISPQGEFAALWAANQDLLGCLQQARPLGADLVAFVEQPFQKGHMFLFNNGPVSFVIVKNGTPNSGEIGQGSWQSFDSEPWTGKEENFCFEGNGLAPPIYDNFNKIWCAEPEVRTNLGLPVDFDSRTLAKLTGSNNAQLVIAQGFDNGFILRDSDGAANRLAYIFLNDGTYLRDRY